ncbi:hypothetical protein DAI22_04g295600 [Oryza sativa Japonica Group]|nr:hypothetical protein DAI22_04g295600 [Oryza sativa Japonica Group]
MMVATTRSVVVSCLLLDLLLVLPLLPSLDSMGKAPPLIAGPPPTTLPPKKVRSSNSIEIE